jgi:hexosaminidase
VDSKYKNSVNSEGVTLIPPTLWSFANTFSEDLKTILDLKVPVTTGTSPAKNSIFVTIGTASDYQDAAGRTSYEGYSIDVTSKGIVITGASPLGVWWGTRSILQQGVLSDSKLTLGSAIDTPGWGIRGTFIDAGRHYYPPDFIIDLCGYLSFFKQNTFHLHLSDSVTVNPDISHEQQLNDYSAFRLNSPSPVVEGLLQLANESYTEADFENIQQSCVSRGVTIIPEIEAPGHALPITKWKPELAQSTDFSQLNISVPETIRTMKSIWSTFLPWFHSKTVHLGADEYSGEVSEYNNYVNTMNEYIGDSFNKSVRIWGTFPPNSTATTNINKQVSIQHWEFFEANPYWDYIKNGYNVLNSDDAFYMVGKWSGSYPQYINLTRVFHGAPDGGPYAPYIFDTSNSSNNPPKVRIEKDFTTLDVTPHANYNQDNPNVLGHLPALWNDFGPNSTSVIEAYYSLRGGLPALADKQWGGDLLMPEYNEIFETLRNIVPGQNLEKSVESKGTEILSYDFSSSKDSLVVDKSGNGYDGTVKGDCKFSNSVLSLGKGCSVEMPLLTKGRNYTLSFSVNPTSSTPGTLFSGSDSALLYGNGSISNVMLVTGGNPYILNYTLPKNSWTDVNLVLIGNATYLGVTESGKKEEIHEFTTTIGDDSNSFIWNNPMAIEAPVQAIGGDTFVGQMKDVSLSSYSDPKYAAVVSPLVIGVAPYTS